MSGIDELFVDHDAIANEEIDKLIETYKDCITYNTIQNINPKIYAIRYTIVNVNLEQMDCRNISTMRSLFSDCIYLKEVNITAINGECITDMSHTFINCDHLEKIKLIINTINVTDMSYMFSKCFKLVDIFLSSSPECEINKITLDTRNVTNMQGMFNKCKSLKNLDISLLNVDKLKNISRMFRYCNSIVNVELPQFTDRTSIVNCIFDQCVLLTKIDMTKFNLIRSTSLLRMLDDCKEIESINFKNLKIPRVYDMTFMMPGCFKLKEIDLSTVDTSNVLSMFKSFTYCKNIDNLNLTGLFDTNSILFMCEAFSGCCKIHEIDLSNFNTSIIHDMGGFFSGGRFISIDLSNFDMKHICIVSGFFMNCYILKHINFGNLFTRSRFKDERWMFEESRIPFSSIGDFDENDRWYNSSMARSLYIYGKFAGKIFSINRKFDPVYGMYKRV